MGGFAPLVNGPRRNALVAALPDATRERLQRVLEPCFLARQQVLHEPDAPLQFAYFPVTADVSLFHLLADGAADEIAAIGSEGLVGVGLILGGDRMPTRAVVERAGWAYRLRRQHVEDEFAHDGAVQQLLLHYVQALITQIAQLAVCNRRHPINQQLCRWLLACADRRATAELRITHEQIAARMGVRREGVTAAAGQLQRDGMIRHERGRITLVDRPALEARACECYAVARRESARLATLGTTGLAPRVVAPADRRARRPLGRAADDQSTGAVYGRTRETSMPRAAAALP